MNFARLMSVFDSFAHVAAPIVIASLWQGLAVALILALCLKFTRRISAAQRFVLGFAAFAAIAALPLASPIGLGIEPASSRVFTASIGADNPSHAWLQLDARWTFVLAALWLIASLVRATDLVIHIARLRRLWRTAASAEIQALPRSTRAFEVCTTESIDRPSVIGFFAPRILIPDWLLPRLTAGELNQIVLHESTHLDRYDDWTNLFQKLCLILFPLNPALWVIDRQLAKERERSCDEAVVRITQAPRAYAACLASLAERGITYQKEALSLGAWRRRSELVDRVHRILRSSHRGLSPVAARLLLASLGCSLLVVVIELARCPQLVAFAPASHAAEAFSNAPALRNAVYSPDPRHYGNTPCARLVQARAIMPSASPAKPFANRAHSKTAAVGELRAASEPGMTQHAAQAIATRQPVTSPLKQEAPQLIVFTAWEQVETTAPANQTVADYDAHPDGGAVTSQTPASASPQNNAQPANASRQNNSPADANTSAQSPIQRRTTFTQLILRVAPAGEKSSQPTAIPFGDGWLVIQL